MYLVYKCMALVIFFETKTYFMKHILYDRQENMPYSSLPSLLIEKAKERIKVMVIMSNFVKKGGGGEAPLPPSDACKILAAICIHIDCICFHIL